MPPGDLGQTIRRERLIEGLPGGLCCDRKSSNLLLMKARAGRSISVTVTFGLASMICAPTEAGAEGEGGK